MLNVSNINRLGLLRSSGIPFDADAASYIAAVEAADGEALEQGTREAINNFVVSLKNQGLWAAINTAVILAGARTLSGALVPLKGTAPTNVNFVSGDYNRYLGLKGNGTTKLINTNVLNSASPQNNNHNAMWINEADSLTGTRIYMSITSVVSGRNAIFRGTTVSAMGVQIRGTASTTVGDVGDATGFLGASRSNSSDVTFRAKAANQTLTQASTTPVAENLGFMGRLDAVAHTNARMTFYSIGESLNMTSYSAAIQKLLTDLILVQPDSDAQAYIAAVEAADGQPLEQGVKVAINEFVATLKIQGLWPNIDNIGLLCGAHTLAGAVVPLKGVGATLFNFVAADYNRKTGLKGDGATKYADTNVANNQSPQNDNHNAVYLTEAPSNSGSSTHMASGIASGDNAFFRGATVTTLRFLNRTGTQTIINATDVTGLIGTTRSAAASYFYRAEGVTDTASVSSSTPSSNNILLFARPTPTAFTNARISMYSTGKSLNLAYLEAAMQVLATKYGGAIA